MAEKRLGVVIVVEYPAESDRFVLVEETKARKKGRLNLPGGEVDEEDYRAGELNERDAPKGIWRAGLREPKEESGLDIKLEHFLGLFDYYEDGKLQIAMAGVAIGGTLSPSAKHPTVDSYPFDEIENELAPQGRLRSDRVLMAISQYREGSVLPIETALHVAPTDVLPEPVSDEAARTGRPT